MDIEEANRIYQHPKGHSKAELTECLEIMNSLGKLPIEGQVVIADARDRLDILEGTIMDAEYRVIDS